MPKRLQPNAPLPTVSAPKQAAGSEPARPLPAPTAAPAKSNAGWSAARRDVEKATQPRTKTAWEGVGVTGAVGATAVATGAALGVTPVGLALGFGFVAYGVYKALVYDSKAVEKDEAKAIIQAMNDRAGASPQSAADKQERLGVLKSICDGVLKDPSGVEPPLEFRLGPGARAALEAEIERLGKS